jgi:hypothetical protein
MQRVMSCLVCCIAVCPEGSWDLEGGGQSGGGSRGSGFSYESSSNRPGISIDFLALVDSLRTRLALSSPPALLLSYSLLHTHPAFLPLLVSSGHARPLLVTLLKTLYQTINTVSTACKEYQRGAVSMKFTPCTVPSLESLYMVVINILLIVQDVKLRPLLSVLSCEGEDLSWYREKALGSQVGHWRTFSCSMICLY